MTKLKSASRGEKRRRGEVARSEKRENVEVSVEGKDRVQREGSACGCLHRVTGTVLQAQGQGIEPGVRGGGEAAHRRPQPPDRFDLRRRRGRGLRRRLHLRPGHPHHHPREGRVPRGREDVPRSRPFLARCHPSRGAQHARSYHHAKGNRIEEVDNIILMVAI